MKSTTIVAFLNHNDKIAYICHTSKNPRSVFMTLTAKSYPSVMSRYFALSNGVKDWEIKELEKITYSDTLELRQHKQHWFTAYSTILGYNIINRHAAYVTHQQKLDKRKQWRIAHRDRELQNKRRRLQYYITCECGVSYKKIGDWAHKKSKHHKIWSENPFYMTSDDIFTFEIQNQSHRANV